MRCRRTFITSSGFTSIGISSTALTGYSSASCVCNRNNIHLKGKIRSAHNSGWSQNDSWWHWFPRNTFDGFCASRWAAAWVFNIKAIDVPCHASRSPVYCISVISLTRIYYHIASSRVSDITVTSNPPGKAWGCRVSSIPTVGDFIMPKSCCVSLIKGQARKSIQRSVSTIKSNSSSYNPFKFSKWVWVFWWHMTAVVGSFLAASDAGLIITCYSKALAPLGIS